MTEQETRMIRIMEHCVLNAEFCDKCEIQIAYAIGVAEPVSICVNAEGIAEDYTIEDLESYIKNNYDLTPQGIIKSLDLLNVDYNKVSAYGHFGDKDVPWEK